MLALKGLLFALAVLSIYFLYYACVGAKRLCVGGGFTSTKSNWGRGERVNEH